jgi:hypothetical protein
MLLSADTKQWEPGEFVCPTARSFYLVLGMHDFHAITSEALMGRIVLLSNQVPVAVFPYNSATSTEVSWLNRKSLRGLALNWPTNKSPFVLSEFMKPGSSYQLRIVPEPAKSASLWLVYDQSAAEASQERRN